MVALRNLTIGYGARVLACGLDVEFTPGTLSAIIGRNGSGKSTLLRTIAGLMKPLSGEVVFEFDNLTIRQIGDEVNAPRNFQIFKFSNSKIQKFVSFVSTERVSVTNLRVGDVVALGRTPYTGWTGRLSPQDKAAVAEALALVGMTDFAHKKLDTLSDGEAQRVMIARALAQDTPVMLLDEPTAFLDYHSRRQIVELLARLAHEQGKTIIFSSHELDLVNEFADKTLEL